MIDSDWTTQCQVELSREDYALLNQARLRLTGRKDWVRFFLVYLITLAAVVWAIQFITGNAWLEIALLVGSVSAVVALPLIRFSGRLNARFYYHTYRVDKLPTKYTIGLKQIALKSATYEGSYSWDAFHSIMRTQTHFLFWVNPMQALVVPFRCLENDALEQIWSFLKEMPNARFTKVSV